MSKTYKLAPIIRKAANKYLYHPNKSFNAHSEPSDYSCTAVLNYIDDNFDSAWKIKDVFNKFAKSKGCPVNSMTAFDKYYSKEKVKPHWSDRTYTFKNATAKSQEIRYAWLYLLADLAEEENIKVKL